MQQRMKRIVFETMNKVNFNTSLLSTIKFDWESKMSYKGKIKKWVINKREINWLLLNRIIDKIYSEKCRNWTLSSSEETFTK